MWLLNLYSDRFTRSRRNQSGYFNIKRRRSNTCSHLNEKPFYFHILIGTWQNKLQYFVESNFWLSPTLALLRPWISIWKSLTNWLETFQVQHYQHLNLKILNKNIRNFSGIPCWSFMSTQSGDCWLPEVKHKPGVQVTQDHSAWPYSHGFYLALVLHTI